MSNFRHNPLTNRWVIIAESRTNRPNEFEQRSIRTASSVCPFCEGNESETPAATTSYPADHADSPTTELKGASDEKWEVRVFPNKYPALETCDADIDQDRGPYRSLKASGHHEIIVESPQHVSSLTEVSDRQLELSFQMYRDRIKFLSETPGIKHAMLFKNCRPEAGASIHHVHSQLIGTPIVPAGVENRVLQAKKFYETHGRCLFKSLLDFELQEGERIVSQTPNFVAFCPYSSRLPYEVWIFHKPPVVEFSRFRDSELAELGYLVRGVLQQMEKVLSDPAYNTLFHLPPFDSNSNDHYQWHMELFPRVSKTAGYEWGTGCMINQVAPENAAAQLRFNDC